MSTKKELTGLEVLAINKGLTECVEAFPAKVAIAVSKSLLNIEKIANILQAELQKIQLKYIARDANGGFIKSDEVPNAFKLTDPKAFDSETNEVLESKHEIEVFPIEIQDVDRLPNITLIQTKLLIILGVLEN